METRKENQKEELGLPEVIRLPEVMRITGLSKSGVYRLIQKRQFPRQMQMTSRCSVWIKSEVYDFLMKKINERNQKIEKEYAE